MVEKILNKHKVVFYDSSEDLPVKQFHRYSKYILVEGGIGDTIQDIDRHIGRIINFLDDKKKAYQELLNLRQCLYIIATEQDVRHKATLCLVKSIDGEDWADFSDEGLKHLYDLVADESVRNLDALAAEVRTAIDDNLTRYFPRVFEDATQKNYADLLRKRALLQLEAISKGVENSEEVAELTKKIVSMQSPKSFDGQESEEILFDKQFEDMCLIMAKEFGGGIKQYTTMEFYTAFERMTRNYEAQKKVNRKKRSK